MMRMIAQMSTLRLVTRMVAPRPARRAVPCGSVLADLTILFFGTKKKHTTVPTMENGSANQKVFVFAEHRHDEARQVSAKHANAQREVGPEEAGGGGQAGGLMYCAIRTTKL